MSTFNKSPKSKGTTRTVLETRADRLSLGAIAMIAAVSSLCEAAVLVLLSYASVDLLAGTPDDGSSVMALPLMQTSPSMNTVVAIGAIMVLTRLALQLVNAQLTAKLSNRVLIRWRERLTDGFLRASWQRQGEEAQGSLQTLVNNNVLQVTAMTQLLASAVTAGFSFLIFVLGAVGLAPLAAVALMTFGVVLFALLRPIARAIRLAAESHRNAASEYGHALDETLSTY